ncbi:D-arabinono-1,4-lactone oxidase [Nocardioides sp. CER19]|uniref:D-arabinono-1,4-lactone oxidase n=1 Tax=Nocardioides sp. CER19 TaxID=3038538 RepID=UPI00244AB383|nr:D-arabinono-1,4-lactone oxidase [Nocardioides sp. CER19]MDH2412834.1 FAD-binding protein [Nocardioides sp. CER19]
MSVGTTWAGSHTYAARALRRPTSLDELSALVVAEPRLRALGSRHSFTDLADSPGVLVDVTGLRGEVTIDAARRVARVPAGLRYGDVATTLHEAGWALGALASLPHISVAGAVATGTHGSGNTVGSLASTVAAVELVDGRGSQVRLERGDADFAGAVVALGLLGIVTTLELDVEPTYDVSQVVLEGLTWDALLARVDEVTAAAYSVSVFTRWTGDLVGQVWLKERGTPRELAGTHPAPEQRHMIAGMSVENTTEQLGVPGPWHQRLPHFRMGFTPSAGEELQSEYFVPRARLAEALAAVRAIGHLVEPELLVSEVRTVGGDDLWLSGAYGGDAAALHFTWQRHPAQVLPLVDRLEEVLLPLGARPHWGKVFRARADVVRPRYPRMDDFLDLAARFDPEGRFRNEWTARTLGR